LFSFNAGETRRGNAELDEFKLPRMMSIGTDGDAATGFSREPHEFDIQVLPIRVSVAYSDSSSNHTGPKARVAHGMANTRQAGYEGC
jgi:hypothetical protein